MFYVGNKHGNEGWKVFGAVVAGLVLAQVRQPAHRVLHLDRDARRCRTSPRRPAPARPPTVLSGIASGLESTVYAIIAIAVAIGVAIALGRATSSSPSTWSP